MICRRLLFFPQFFLVSPPYLFCALTLAYIRYAVSLSLSRRGDGIQSPAINTSLTQILRARCERNPVHQLTMHFLKPLHTQRTVATPPLGWSDCFRPRSDITITKDWFLSLRLTKPTKPLRDSMPENDCTSRLSPPLLHRTQSSPPAISRCDNGAKSSDLVRQIKGCQWLVKSATDERESKRSRSRFSVGFFDYFWQLMSPFSSSQVWKRISSSSSTCSESWNSLLVDDWRFAVLGCEAVVCSLYTVTILGLSWPNYYLFVRIRCLGS